MNKLIILMTLVCFTATSCSTLTRDSYQKVTITPNPIQAEVFVDGEKMGRGEQILTLKRDQVHRVEVTHPGYSEESREITPSIGKAVVKNGALGILAGLGTVGSLMAHYGGVIFIALPAVVGIGALVTGGVLIVGTGIDMATGCGYNLSSGDQVNINLKPM